MPADCPSPRWRRSRRMRTRVVGVLVFPVVREHIRIGCGGLEAHHLILAHGYRCAWRRVNVVDLQGGNGWRLVRRVGELDPHLDRSVLCIPFDRSDVNAVDGVAERAADDKSRIRIVILSYGVHIDDVSRDAGAFAPGELHPAANALVAPRRVVPHAHVIRPGRLRRDFQPVSAARDGRIKGVHGVHPVESARVRRANRAQLVGRHPAEDVPRANVP